MNFFNLCMLVGGTLLAIAWLPQLWRIYRTKSVKDFSIPTLVLIFTGLVLCEVYAFGYVSGRLMYAVMNGVSVLVLVAVLVSVLVYRKDGE